MVAWFPGEPRPGQLEAAEAIHTNMLDRATLFLEAPTGLGKTRAAVAAAWEMYRRTGQRTLFLTRTNSQQFQFLREARALGANLLPLVGRRHHCNQLDGLEGYEEATAEEVSRSCRKLKQAPPGERCPAFERLDDLDLSALASQPDPIAAFRDAGACPYEGIKLLLPETALISMPYAFLVYPNLRRAVLNWMDASPGRVHVVIDEAHNFPDALIQAARLRWTQSRHDKAIREAEELGNPSLGPVTATQVLDAVVLAARAIRRGYLEGDLGQDIPVAQGALVEELMGLLQCNSTQLYQYAAHFDQLAEVIRERRDGTPRMPRSQLGAFAHFLGRYLLEGETPSLHVIGGSDGLILGCERLWPSDEAQFLKEFASVTLMSGTLLPSEDLEAALDLMEPTILRIDHQQGSLQFHITPGIRRNFEADRVDPSGEMARQDSAQSILAKHQGRALLLHPSWEYLEAWQEEGVHDDLQRPILLERRGMQVSEQEGLMARFEATPDGVLVGVLGGRFGEGVDYPGGMLECVILTAVPYPPPSLLQDARIRLVERRFPGQGWNYVVHNPVGRRMRQAIGRLVRGPTDRGYAYLIDDRGVRFRDQLGPFQWYGEQGTFQTGLAFQEAKKKSS